PRRQERFHLRPELLGNTPTVFARCRSHGHHKSSKSRGPQFFDSFDAGVYLALTSYRNRFLLASIRRCGRRKRRNRCRRAREAGTRILSWPREMTPSLRVGDDDQGFGAGEDAGERALEGLGVEGGEALVEDARVERLQEGAGDEEAAALAV